MRNVCKSFFFNTSSKNMASIPPFLLSVFFSFFPANIHFLDCFLSYDSTSALIYLFSAFREATPHLLSSPPLSHTHTHTHNCFFSCNLLRHVSTFLPNRHVYPRMKFWQRVLPILITRRDASTSYTCMKQNTVRRLGSEAGGTGLEQGYQLGI